MLIFSKSPLWFGVDLSLPDVDWNYEINNKSPIPKDIK